MSNASRFLMILQLTLVSNNVRYIQTEIIIACRVIISINKCLDIHISYLGTNKLEALTLHNFM